MLTFSTIAPVSALTDYIDDGVSEKFLSLGSINAYNRFDACIKKNAGATVLVSQDSFLSDGLSASRLIGARNANMVPVYKVNGKSAVYWEQIVTKDVYIIGGEKVVSRDLENNLRKAGYNVKRLQGINRYETSYNVAKEISKFTNINTVAIVNGKNGQADAVSIASAAIKKKMPVIVTDGKKLNSNLKSVKVYAIGGKSVISESLVKKTRATRISGRNRFETNKNIIKRFYPRCKKFTIIESKLAYRSFAVCPITANQPIVLADVKSDKSVLSGAKELLFVYFKDLHPNIESSCLASAGGGGVYKAYETLYKKLGNKREDMCYLYNQKGNYADK